MERSEDNILTVNNKNRNGQKKEKVLRYTVKKYLTLRYQMHLIDAKFRVHRDLQYLARTKSTFNNVLARIYRLIDLLHMNQAMQDGITE